MWYEVFYVMTCYIARQVLVDEPELHVHRMAVAIDI